MTTTLLLAGILLAASNGPEKTLRFSENAAARGEIADRLSRVYGRLTSPPLDDPEFVLSDVTFALTRRFTEYSGDISGRTLTALEDAAELLRRKPAIVPALMAGFAEHQKPDGHYGADQNLDQEVNQARDMPILWGNGRLLFGLARHCRQHRNPAKLDLARKLGDYMCSTRKYYGKEENFKAVGGLYASGFTTCYPSMVDGLVALAEVTGDRKYADEARFIANLSLLDDAFPKHHSHGRLTTYRGMLDLDWLAGTNDFVDKVRGYCAKIAAEHQLPTGGVTELFDRDYVLDEGCTEADWLWVHLLLWRATDEPAYLDAAEHILRNHLLAAQFPNGGFGHRPLRAMKHAGNTFYGCGFTPDGVESYWCCAMHGAQALAQTVQYGLVSRGDAIDITWLAEVSGDFDISGRDVNILTRRLSPVEWEVQATSDKPGDVKFRLRVPGWAKSARVDGAEKPAVNGWLEMTRNIIGRQTFKVSFPLSIRLQGAYAAEPIEGEPMRIFAGPDMYCLPDAEVNEGLLEKDEVPTIVVAANKPVDGALPVVIENAQGGRQQARFVPLASRPIGGCRHVFRARRVDDQTFDELAQSASKAPEIGPPVVLTFTCDGELELFLNGKKLSSGRPAPEERIREAHGLRGENVVTLSVRGKKQRPAFIGTIRAGGRVYVTDAEQWSAAKGETPIKLQDLGAWGIDPWKHVSAQYAGTGAHWLAPAESQPDGRYTVRYVFTIP